VGDFVVLVLGLVSRTPIACGVLARLRRYPTVVAAPVLIGQIRRAQELVEAAHVNLNAPGWHAARHFPNLVEIGSHSSCRNTAYGLRLLFW
jgi:hypothetical protein